MANERLKGFNYVALHTAQITDGCEAIRQAVSGCMGTRYMSDVAVAQIVQARKAIEIALHDLNEAYAQRLAEAHKNGMDDGMGWIEAAEGNAG